MFFTSTVETATDGLQNMLSQFTEGITLPRILATAVLLVICIVFVKLLLKMTGRMLNKGKLEKSLHTFVYSAVKLVLIFVAIMLLAGTLGVDTTSLLAVFSIAGLALSLSIQDALSNLASGIMILTSKPFHVGDFIEVKGRSGTVEEIGLIYTKLSTVDRQILHIPNSQITSNDLSNYSACDQRQVIIPIKVAYSSDIDRVKAALTRAARDERLVPGKPIFARISGYGDSAMEFSLRVWVKTEDYWNVYFDVLERIKRCFDEDGIKLTFPHLFIHTKDPLSASRD